MAKHRKSYHRSSGCPEPINTLIDIAGAATMRAINKKIILRQYEKGNGDEAALATGTAFAAGALRSGSSGIVSLGGLYGVTDALKEVEKRKSTQKSSCAYVPDEIPIEEYHSNDNRYAWRLNCEDGTPYGLSPYDFDTRDAYNIALTIAKGQPAAHTSHQPVQNQDVVDNFSEDFQTFLFCRVSRIDNGSNEYFLTENENIKIGDIVNVPVNGGVASAVVLTLELHTRKTAPKPPEDTNYIL